MNDIVAKIQQGNWTDADVSEAVAEIVRLREMSRRMKNCLILYVEGRRPAIEDVEPLIR